MNTLRTCSPSRRRSPLHKGLRTTISSRCVPIYNYRPLSPFPAVKTAELTPPLRITAASHTRFVCAFFIGLRHYRLTPVYTSRSSTTYTSMSFPNLMRQTRRGSLSDGPRNLTSWKKSRSITRNSLESYKAHLWPRVGNKR